MLSLPARNQGLDLSPTQRLVLLAAAVALTAMTAAASGALLGTAPVFALAPVAGLGALALLSRGEKLVSIFLVLLIVLLFGYAFLGRGFAHIGHAPLYVSEPVLGLAALVVLIRVVQTKLTALHWLLFAFMFLGLMRTVPYLQRDGVNALRDAVVWGYAVFAFAISMAVRPSHLSAIANLYRRFAPIFLIWVPILFVLNTFFLGYLPVAPGSDVQIPFYQPGDVGVHLAGVAGFALGGLYTYHKRINPLPLVILAGFWMAGFLISGSINRGAFMAALMGLGFCFVLKPSVKWVPFATVALALIALLLVINPTIQLEGRSRNVSVQQAVANATSVVSSSGDSGLEPTREWRLAWWNEIIDYTIKGPYFWNGKGYGVNLADDDGFQVYADHSLRSPHNNHLTILARSGVPGFILWIAMNGVFVFSLLGVRRRATANGDEMRSGFVVWLLVYWLAMMVNGTFTLYLEAPHEGIWYWTIFGLGLVLISDEARRYGRPLRATAPLRAPAPARRRPLMPAGAAIPAHSQADANPSPRQTTPQAEGSAGS